MAGPEPDGATAVVDELVVEDHFAMVPEWLLDAPISDCAVRLYAVLLRYGQSAGARMPARSTLATRLGKKSTDTVDRAMRELVDAGAVYVQPRFAGRERLTNLYQVRTSRPTQSTGSDPTADAAPAHRQPKEGLEGGGRKVSNPKRTFSSADPLTRTAARSSTAQHRRRLRHRRLGRLRRRLPHPTLHRRPTRRPLGRTLPRSRPPPRRPGPGLARQPPDRPCSRSQPTPNPGHRCASPKPDPGGTTPDPPPTLVFPRARWRRPKPN